MGHVIQMQIVHRRGARAIFVQMILDLSLPARQYQTTPQLRDIPADASSPRAFGINSLWYTPCMDIHTIKNLAIPVLKKHRVTRAAIFGSATRGEMTDVSDVDVLVELPKDIHGFDYVALKVDLQEELKNTLGRNVDVIEYNLIKPDLKQYILPHQVQIL